jgi:MFS family permease
MRANLASPSPPAIALAGLGTLAIAMGIGRFAFTPILPMMQQDSGLSVREGGWLASANYLGFLLGSVAAIRLRVRPTYAIRWGLPVIGIVTIAMGSEHEFAGWIVLRAIAGVANALAQISAFAWCVGRLSAAGRPLLNGLAFAGTGTGILLVGLFCLLLMYIDATSGQAWIGLGVIALLGTAAIWPVLARPEDLLAEARESAPAAGRRWDAEWLRLILCFGASGVGYIVPATFIPAMGRQLVPDPLVFGWSWPAFGLAAALAPIIAAPWARRLGNRRLWALSQLAMGVGVVLPVVWPAIAGILVAALLVGGAFMVNGLASMQEARVVAGADATALMAAMTAAFATGQVLGPIVVSSLVGADERFTTVLPLAAAALVASAMALSNSSPRRPAQAHAVYAGSRLTGEQ